MRAHSNIKSYDYSKNDGFDLIPRDPKKVFLLKVNPLLHHLPTKLAASRTGKWRVPPALAKMDDESVVILWQDGPNAGIHGIAVPYGSSFMSYSSIFKPVSHLEFSRYGFKEAKLRCVYILPTPILSTTLESKGMVVSEIKRPRAQQRIGCKLKRQTWSALYDLMAQGRDSKFDLAVERPEELQHPVVGFIQRLEQCVPPDGGASQLSDPYALAQRTWMVLTQSATTRTLVSASTLSKIFVVSPDQIQACIDLINSICMLENLPSLASLTLTSNESADLSDQPHSILNLSLVQQSVSIPVSRAANNFDWAQIPNPFDFTLQISSEKLISELEKNPSLEQAENMYKMIKVRGTAQALFASLMRRLYDWQCAFCGFSVPFALEAAHIKPWPFCTPGERLMPSNGLLLCALHHKLFDAGLFTLSAERLKRSAESRFIVKVMAPDSILCISKADINNVKSLHGVTARMPLRSEHRPNSEFLDFRKNLVAEKIAHKAMHFPNLIDKLGMSV